MTIIPEKAVSTLHNALGVKKGTKSSS
jgi:hypothetical protein